MVSNPGSSSRKARGRTVSLVSSSASRASSSGKVKHLMASRASSSGSRAIPSKRHTDRLPTASLANPRNMADMLSPNNHGNLGKLDNQHNREKHPMRPKAPGNSKLLRPRANHVLAQ